MWDGLVAIYEEGLVDAVGLSNYGPRQLAKIGQYLDKRGVPLAAVQVQYSLLRWALLVRWGAPGRVACVRRSAGMVRRHARQIARRCVAGQTGVADAACKFQHAGNTFLLLLLLLLLLLSLSLSLSNSDTPGTRSCACPVLQPRTRAGCCQGGV